MSNIEIMTDEEFRAARSKLDALKAELEVARAPGASMALGRDGRDWVYGAYGRTAVGMARRMVRGALGVVPGMAMINSARRRRKPAPSSPTGEGRT